MPYGTNDLRDASSFLNFGNLEDTVAKVGEEVIYEEVQEVLDVYNEEVETLYGELALRTEQYTGIYGGGNTGIRMRRGNELSNPDAIKVALTPVTMGFTIDKYETAVQWTKRGFEQMSVEKFRQQFLAILQEDARLFRENLIKAIFNPVTDLSYVDYLNEYRTFAVYPFLNADGMPIPLSPSGSRFDPATHSHYNAATTLTEQVIRDTVTNVTEHGTEGDVAIYIPASFESIVWNMQTTGAFHPRLIPNIVPVMPTSGISAMNVGYASGDTLDIQNPSNRTIGTFGGREVRVRSWVPPQYILVIDTGSATKKPLAHRVLPGGLYSELGIRYEDDMYHLRSSVVDRYYGFTPHQRHMLAITYISTAVPGASSSFSGVYVAPTIA